MKKLNPDLTLNLLNSKLQLSAIYLIENKINFHANCKGLTLTKKVLKNLFISESFIFKSLKFPLKLFLFKNLCNFILFLLSYKQNNILSNITFIKLKQFLFYIRIKLIDLFVLESTYLNLIYSVEFTCE